MATKPTKAQAKFLAMVWAGAIKPRISVYTMPTTEECLRRGWLTTRGVADVYADGAYYEQAHITSAGVAALAAYLTAKVRKAGVTWAGRQRKCARWN